MHRTAIGLPLLLALSGCGGDQSRSSTPRPDRSTAARRDSECQRDSDCQAKASPCQLASCQNGQCRTTPQRVGFIPPDPVKGDCKALTCAHQGTVVELADPDDRPRSEHDCHAMRCTPTGPAEVVAPWQACRGGGACTSEGACVKIAGLATGDHHGCLWFEDGTVRCFGLDDWGELGGVPDAMPQRTAAPLPFVKDVIQLSANDAQSCALRRDGSVLCWGNNGDDGYKAKLAKRGPVMATIEKLGPATQISATSRQSCALHSEGVISCWDSASWRPVLIGKPRRPVAKLVVGPNGVCGVLDDQSVQCFRTRFEEDPSARSVLPDAAKLHGVRSLALGRVHACAVLAGGEVHCWGTDMNGEVNPKSGNGWNRPWIAPTKLEGLPPAEAVAVAFRHSCAILADQRVMCWGMPDDGEGLGLLRTLPIRARAIGLSYESGCALATEGTAQCWGSDVFGRTTSHEYRPAARFWPVTL
jgi:alpha-tubulin suppressor-like RCC1 family protein